jgi:hypothetical protein
VKRGEGKNSVEYAIHSSPIETRVTGENEKSGMRGVRGGSVEETTYRSGTTPHVLRRGRTERGKTETDGRASIFLRSVV